MAEEVYPASSAPGARAGRRKRPSAHELDPLARPASREKLVAPARTTVCAFARYGDSLQLARPGAQESAPARRANRPSTRLQPNIHGAVATRARRQL
jgi:hypothetical protein